jgi:hypothetical protein
MEAQEFVLDSIEWKGDHVKLTKVLGGNVVGHSEKYQIDFQIEGYGMGQLNYPRTPEKFEEATDKYVELYQIVSNKIKL